MKTQDRNQISFYELAARHCPSHLLASMKAVFLKSTHENLSFEEAAAFYETAEARQAALYLRHLKEYYDGAPVFYEDLIEKLRLDYWMDNDYHEETENY